MLFSLQNVHSQRSNELLRFGKIRFKKKNRTTKVSTFFSARKVKFIINWLHFKTFEQSIFSNLSIFMFFAREYFRVSATSVLILILNILWENFHGKTCQLPINLMTFFLWHKYCFIFKLCHLNSWFPYAAIDWPPNRCSVSSQFTTTIRSQSGYVKCA